VVDSVSDYLVYILIGCLFSGYSGLISVGLDFESIFLVHGL
jgi:hypothetical protein